MTFVTLEGYFIHWATITPGGLSHLKLMVFCTKGPTNVSLLLWQCDLSWNQFLSGTLSCFFTIAKQTLIPLHYSTSLIRRLNIIIFIIPLSFYITSCVSFRSWGAREKYSFYVSVGVLTIIILLELASQMVHSINTAQRYCRNEQAGYNQAGHLPELGHFDEKQLPFQQNWHIILILQIGQSSQPSVFPVLTSINALIYVQVINNTQIHTFMTLFYLEFPETWRIQIIIL